MKPARVHWRVPAADPLLIPPAAPARAPQARGAPPLAARGGERVTGRLRWWAVGLLLVVACTVALLAAQGNPYLGDYGDDAELLVLGQGLATGQGYAWVNSPERAPHNRYPPAYPALLAATMTLSRTALDPAGAVPFAKLATAATLFGAAALLWPIARRRLPAPWAAGAVALFLLNPFVIRFAGEVMSDVPYVLALMGALAWADGLAARTRRSGGGLLGGECRGGAGAPHETTLVGPSGATRTRQSGAPLPAGGKDDSPSPGGGGPRSERWGWGEWAILGALLALGAYVRSIGLVAAGATLAWAWWAAWRRPGIPWRGPALATGALALLLLPWWLRDASLAGGWRYVEELLAAQYLAPTEGTVTAGDLLGRAAGNVAFLVGKPGVFGAAGLAVGLVGAAVVATGYVRTLRRSGGAAEWVAVALTVAVLFWPIRTGRYLLPVLPLLGIYAVSGALAIGAVLPGRLRRLAPGVVAAGVVGALLVQGLYAGREAVANARALGAGGGVAGYYAGRSEWARYLEAAGWVREHAAPGAVALGRRHFLLYVYGGHYADKFRFETTDEELAYLFSGTGQKFVVEDAFPELRGDFAPLPVAVRARGGDLRLRFETGEPRVRVWELIRPVGAVGAAGPVSAVGPVGGAAAGAGATERRNGDATMESVARRSPGTDAEFALRSG